MLDSVPVTELWKLLGIQCSYNSRAVHSAAGGGHMEVVKCILDSLPATDLCKLLSIQKGDGNTLVHIAAERGHTKILIHVG